MSNWFENLPPQCPDSRAQPPDNKIYYRVVESENISCEDFWSHRKIYPNKAFKVTECIARSVSLFDNLAKAEALLLLPLHKGKCVAEIMLTPDSGVVMKTLGPYHYSWWRLVGFDPVKKAKIVNE